MGSRLFQRMGGLVAAALCCLEVACGSANSSSVTTPVTCTMNLPYTALAAPVTGATLETLTYSVTFSPECTELVMDHSGGLSYRVDATAEPSTGLMSSIDLGGGRTEAYSGTNGHTLASGGVTAQNTFQAVAAQQNSGQWILPWQTAPDQATVYFQFPAGSEVKLYPTQVVLTLTATDQ